MELLGVIWFFSFLACAIIGARKGNFLGASFLAIVLGPLALLIVAVSRDKNKKKCNHCAMLIPAEARICPFCRKDL